uniref:Transposase n=1 Tax=Heterorhabditis bacteriophora TaxID=37862 RepID=A0A1I7WLK9_HETBA
MSDDIREAMRIIAALKKTRSLWPYYYYYYY